MGDQIGAPVHVVPEGVQTRLQAAAGSLSEAEQRVAAFVERNAPEAVRLPVKVLADRIGVSEATIVRFCQSLGYRGLRDLRLALAAETAAPLLAVREDIQPNDSVITIARKLIQTDIQMLVNTLAVVDADALERAVAALLAAPRIAFIGMGNSLALVIDTQHRFAQIGLPATYHTDPYGMLSAAALLPAGSVAFAISHSGRTPDVVRALAAAREAGATSVLLTSHANTPASEQADIELITAMADTPLPISESVSSRMAHYAVIDALYHTVINRRPDEALSALARVRVALAARSTRP